MKIGKAARAMAHIDEDLILSAMRDPAPRATNTPERRNPMKNMKAWQKWTALAACLAVILGGGLIFGHFLGAAGATTVIALDVNPSIELEIGRDERVAEIRPLNEDAVAVIGEMELVGVDMEVAVNALIGSMADKGYLGNEQNSILISVDSRAGTGSEALRTRLADRVTAILGERQVEISLITQDFDKRHTAPDGISAAKATLIERIIAAGLQNANGVPYTAETLGRLSINELKLILESKGLAIKGTVTAGAASAGKYAVTVEEAKATALLRAGVTAADVQNLEIEFDFDDRRGVMVYEVEFILGENEHEYEIDTATGEILDEGIAPRGEDDDDIPVTPSAACMSREAALAIAYAEAGVAEADVIRPKIELDREGSLYVYEIEFKTAAYEYEYEINAETGEVLDRETERRD